jgi:hypothetical protein
MSNIDDIRFRKVVIGTGVTIALSMATAVQAQTLDELRDRLDPPPETEKEYLDIIAQMDAIELYQRYEFCRQNDLSKADCMDRISLLWDEEDRWRELFLISISFLSDQEGGMEAHDALFEQCNTLHPDFIAETECRTELNEYLLDVVNNDAHGSIFFSGDGRVIHQSPEGAESGQSVGGMRDKNAPPGTAGR